MHGRNPFLLVIDQRPKWIIAPESINRTPSETCFVHFFKIFHTKDQIGFIGPLQKIVHPLISSFTRVIKLVMEMQQKHVFVVSLMTSILQEAMPGSSLSQEEFLSHRNDLGSQIEEALGIITYANSESLLNGWQFYLNSDKLLKKITKDLHKKFICVENFLAFFVAGDPRIKPVIVQVAQYHIEKLLVKEIKKEQKEIEKQQKAEEEKRNL